MIKMKKNLWNKYFLIYFSLIFILIIIFIINIKIEKSENIEFIDSLKIKDKLSNFDINNSNYEISNLYYLILNHPKELNISYSFIGINENLKLEYYEISRRKYLFLNDFWYLYIYIFNEKSCYFIVKFENIITGFNFWNIKFKGKPFVNNLIIMKISNLIKKFNLNIRIIPIG
jgi:hypothetical protein